MVLLHTGSLLVALFLLNIMWFIKLVAAACKPKADVPVKKDELVNKKRK